MKYLNPFVTHGLTPFKVTGYEAQSTEPVPDDVEKIRSELIEYKEASCPACDLGGCMINGVTRKH